MTLKLNGSPLMNRERISRAVFSVTGTDTTSQTHTGDATSDGLLFCDLSVSAVG